MNPLFLGRTKRTKENKKNHIYIYISRNTFFCFFTFTLPPAACFFLHVSLTMNEQVGLVVAAGATFRVDCWVLGFSGVTGYERETVTHKSRLSITESNGRETRVYVCDSFFFFFFIPPPPLTLSFLGPYDAGRSASQGHTRLQRNVPCR